MKNISIENRKALGGFTNKVEVTETNEHKGMTLGTAVADGDKTQELMTDHLEEETETAMLFDFGWVPKDKIVALIWERAADLEFDRPTVRRVRFAK